MTKMHNPLVLQQVTLPSGVCFFFNPVMGTSQDPGIENIQTDLLVLTQLTGSRMSHGMEKIDIKLAGALSRAIKENDFSGRAGQTVLLDCRDIPSASQKYILLVGLGNLQHFKGHTVCGLMRKALEAARELGVCRMTLPIFPNRQTEDELTLAGSAAVMACRAATFGALPRLQEVELFCTPQARRHLQNGLLAPVPRCEACHNPELGVAD